MALTADEELYLKKKIQCEKLDAKIRVAEAALKAAIQHEKDDLNNGIITVAQYDINVAQLNADYEANNATLWTKNALRYSEMVAARDAVTEE